jgi:hypothetical protein
MADGSQVLKRLDFPAYCVKLLDNGLIAIAGGGGTSKTGVGNSIELGLIEYDYDPKSNDTETSGTGSARFKSIHTFVPNDAIMKFVSFTNERHTAITTTGKIASNSSLGSSKNKNNKIKREKSSNESASVNTKLSDLFIAAPVNNTIEIYKLVPSINRTIENGSVVNNQSQNDKTVIKRKNSKRKGSTASVSTNQDSKIETSAYLKLSNIVRMSEVDESLSDPFEDMPINNHHNSTSKNRLNSVNSKSANNLLQATNLDNAESITSLSVCKLKNTTCKNNNKSNDSIFLCAGTSKGNIIVWNLLLDAIGSTSSISNINDKIRYEKLHEFQQVHGKQEIDDLQTKSINDDQHLLLSIGRDNHCFVWSLKTFAKLNEIKYIEFLNNDSNQRMKHARFTNLPPSSENENCLYTTFIPRIRGGGKDMSSYVVRWCFKTSNEKFLYRFECKRRIKNTIITTMQTSKDGTAVCLGDYEGRISLYDMNFNELANFKKQHSSVITDLAFCHDFSNCLDMNKLILTISIDRTLQCYKYINSKTNSKLGKFLNSLSSTSSTATSTKNISDFINSNDSDSLFGLLNKLDVFSMSLFKLVFYFVVFIILFCHFFTHLE